MVVRGDWSIRVIGYYFLFVIMMRLFNSGEPDKNGVLS